MVAHAHAWSHLRGVWGGHGPFVEDVGQAARFAYDAGLLALYEALGYNELDQASTSIYILEDGTVLTRDQLSDEQEQLDAASAAAMAESWLDEEGRIDRVRLQAFWEWWLNEAIPAAWATAPLHDAPFPWKSHHAQEEYSSASE